MIERQIGGLCRWLSEITSSTRHLLGSLNPVWEDGSIHSYFNKSVMLSWKEALVYQEQLWSVCEWDNSSVCEAHGHECSQAGQSTQTHTHNGHQKTLRMGYWINIWLQMRPLGRDYIFSESLFGAWPCCYHWVNLKLYHINDISNNNNCNGQHSSPQWPLTASNRSAARRSHLSLLFRKGSWNAKRCVWPHSKLPLPSRSWWTLLKFPHKKGCRLNAYSLQCLSLTF